MTDGSGFCFRHNPATEEKRKISDRRGGKMRGSLALDPLFPAVDLKTPSDVARFLETLAIDTRRGKVTPTASRALTAVCTTLLSALTSSDLEKRLQAIEEKLDRQNNRR